MKKLERKEETPSHGIAVGRNRVLPEILIISLIWICPVLIRKIRKNRHREERIKKMKRLEKIAEAIMRETLRTFWTGKNRRRIDRVLSRMDEIKDTLKFLPSEEEMIKSMKELGAPVSASEIGIDQELLRDTFHHAKDYRSRYTVFKTLDELGLLNEAIEKIL